MNKNTESHLDKFLRKIAKGSGIVFIGVILGRVAGYVFRVIVARGLGASAYGLISLGISFLTIIMPLSLLGLPKGVIRFVSLFKGKGKKDGIRGTLRSSFKIALPISLALSLFSFHFSGWISTRIFHNPNFASVLRVFSIGIPLLGLAKLLISGLVGFQRMDYRIYSQNIAQYFGRIVFVVPVVLLGWSVIGVSFAYLASILFCAVVALYFLHTKLIPIFGSDTKDPFIGKKLLDYSLPLMLAGFLMVILEQIDTLMIGTLKTSMDVGLYNAARPTARLVPVGAFGMIFFPVITELYGKGEKETAGELFKVVTKWVFMVALPLTLILAFFSGTVLRILFGFTYVDASGALSILAVGMFVSYLFMTSRRLIEAVGKTKLILLVNFVAAGSDIVLNYLLIPHYGIEGAALATAISVALGGMAVGLLTIRSTGLFPFRWGHGKILVSGTIPVIPLFVSSRYFFSSSSIYLIVILALMYFLIYLLLLMTLGSFDEEDLIIIKAIEQETGMNLDFFKRWIRDFQ